MASIALVLALAGPAAPAPKADTGLARDLIDLIPEDTAGVLVIDIPRAAKSDIGQAILKQIAAGQTPDDPFQVADLVKDAELLIVSQFLIDKGFGDFCLLIRHKEGSAVAKELVARAERDGKDKAPEQIGKRTVYSLQDPGVSFAKVDDRTLMLVLAIGTKEQVKETRAAAFGDREKPGPLGPLRKQIAAGDKDDRAVRLYGSHPTKLGLSTWLVLAAFGIKDNQLEGFGDSVISYRGGIKAGETGEIEVRITTKSADAARALLKAYDDGGQDKDPFIQEMRANGKAVRDGTT
jgi:hypothetical protein